MTDKEISYKIETVLSCPNENSFERFETLTATLLTITNPPDSIVIFDLIILYWISSILYRFDGENPSNLFYKEPFKHVTKDRKKNRFVVKVMKASL